MDWRAGALTAPPTGTDNILVIEDDPAAQANLRDILELDGYRVETAITGRQALERVRSSNYLAILLDRRLPDGSADDLLPQVKQMAPDTEVIIITGHVDLEGTITALRHGAADYLPKPIDAAVLRAALARVIRLRDAERRAQQAEQMAALGQMAAVLAHEGRNALHLMALNLRSLAVVVQGQIEALELIAQVKKSRDNLTRLFEDLRCYGGALSLERETLDVRAIWRNVWENVSVSGRDQRAELVEETGGADLHCDGDQFRLEQVFRNLFENALAACPNPVRVEVRGSEVSHAGRPALHVVVADNGPGLTPEQRQRAFEPFYTTKSKGTGLGLAIVKRIIEAHGGAIAVGGGSGGAEFAILLPRERKE